MNATFTRGAFVRSKINRDFDRGHTSAANVRAAKFGQP